MNWICDLWLLKLNNLQDAGNIFILSEIWSAAKAATLHVTKINNIVDSFVTILCFEFSEVVAIVMFGKPINLIIF